MRGWEVHRERVGVANTRALYRCGVRGGGVTGNRWGGEGVGSLEATVAGEIHGIFFS